MNIKIFLRSLMSVVGLNLLFVISLNFAQADEQNLATDNLITDATKTPPQEQQTPDITTRQEKDRLVREYRVNGQLYAIEIIPKNSPPYFLIDPKGDGNFVRAPNDTRRIAIPQWTLIRW